MPTAKVNGKPMVTDGALSTAIKTPAKGRKAVDDIVIKISPIKKARLVIRVRGVSPLIVHRWSEKAKREILDKQMKVARGAKQAKDPVEDYFNTMYRFEDGSHGFPAIAFKLSAVEAATQVDGAKKTHMRKAFHVLGDLVKINFTGDPEVQGVFENEKVAKRYEKYNPTGQLPALREDMVRIAMGTADIRFRAEYQNWSANLLIEYDSQAISPSEIANLLNRAGFSVGVGVWRVEKDGNHGMFEVDTSSEFDASAMSDERFEELLKLNTITQKPSFDIKSLIEEMVREESAPPKKVSSGKKAVGDAEGEDEPSEEEVLAALEDED
jgi:hypothetical protein